MTISVQYDQCMIQHKNEPNQSIACCLQQCNKKDLVCQEKCIESFNEGIKEPFVLPHLSRLQVYAILSALFTWAIATDQIQLPPSMTHRTLLITLVYFVLYRVVKKIY